MTAAYRIVDTERASEYAKELMGIPEARPTRKPSRIAALARTVWRSDVFRGALFIAWSFLVALPVAAIVVIEVYRVWVFVFHALGISCTDGGCL